MAKKKYCVICWRPNQKIGHVITHKTLREMKRALAFAKSQGLKCSKIAKE